MVPFGDLISSSAAIAEKFASLSASAASQSFRCVPDWELDAKLSSISFFAASHFANLSFRRSMPKALEETPTASFSSKALTLASLSVRRTATSAAAVTRCSSAFDVASFSAARTAAFAASAAADIAAAVSCSSSSLIFASRSCKTLTLEAEAASLSSSSLIFSLVATGVAPSTSLASHAASFSLVAAASAAALSCSFSFC
mmetsp:Transcript_72064/g.208670  ORF Transcript_72064/g.208670 Transcript_72064/m.208670 type:complete len:200 (+) Transcript_72064:217-816(+)